MCGRFVMLSAEELREVADAIAGRAAARTLHLRAEAERRQAYPGSTVATIGRNANGISTRNLNWGFPSNARGTVFNTRIESALAGSPMWREALREGRCVIPAASFYETHRNEKVTSLRTGKPVKRPYAFQSADGLPLLMAGVSDKGNCSVVTCEPNRSVSPVHPRMPLVLRFEEVPLWLDGDAADWGDLADRSEIELRSHPESGPTGDGHGGHDGHDGQLSLF